MRRIIGVLFAVGVLLAVPITLRPADVDHETPTLAVNDACAYAGSCVMSAQLLQTAFGTVTLSGVGALCEAGECCQELGSICTDTETPLIDHRSCDRW